MAQGQFFVNPNELLPDQREYLEKILAPQQRTAKIVPLCTCLFGGSLNPDEKTRAAIAASRERCPIHGKHRRVPAP